MTNFAEGLTPTSTPEQVQAAWIAALESGEFEQGKSRLRERGETKDTFCCLGVVAELAVSAGVIPVPAVPVYVGEGYNYTDSKSWNSTGVLNGTLREWVGLSTANGGFQTPPDVTGMVHWRSLTELNDAKNYTFKQIAEVIRSRPKGLFIDGQSTETTQRVDESPSGEV